MSGLRSASLGAPVTLYLFGDELDMLFIYSFVELVMLVGVVKKNAIIQIDFALEAERPHGSRRRMRSTLTAGSDTENLTLEIDSLAWERFSVAPIVCRTSK